MTHCKCGRIMPSNRIPAIRTQTGNKVELKDLNVNTVVTPEIHYIPKGSKNIKFTGTPACLVDCVVVPQVFHLDGKLLVGSPVIQDPRVSNRTHNGSNVWGFVTGATASPDPRPLQDIRDAVTQYVKANAPARYTGNFTFDDSTVNGTGAFMAYSTSMYTVTVAGETIQWNGDQLDTWPGRGDSSLDNIVNINTWISNLSTNPDYDPPATIKCKLSIDEAKDDLFIIMIGTCWHVYVASWDLPSSDPPDPPDPPEPPEPEPVPVPATCDRPRIWQKREANENKQHFGI